MEGLSFFALYMLPSMIAWYRRKQGKSIALPFRTLVFFNFFAGWTIVGWFLSLANALGYNPVASVVPSLIRYLPSSGPVANVPQGGSPGPVSSPCGQCGGTGRMPCSSCGARGSWYDPPQGASGAAELRTCGACLSSGRVSCVSCGGTGRAQALIG
jgi:hypothetical protein